MFQKKSNDQNSVLLIQGFSDRNDSQIRTYEVDGDANYNSQTNKQGRKTRVLVNCINLTTIDCGCYSAGDKCAHRNSEHYAHSFAVRNTFLRPQMFRYSVVLFVPVARSDKSGVVN